MATLTHTATSAPASTTNWLATFDAFARKAEFTRIGWAATALMIQGCILTPALLLTMFYFGGADWQLLTANLCFLLVLVPILGAQPVKYIFGAFGISFLVHISLILLNIL